MTKLYNLPKNTIKKGIPSVFGSAHTKHTNSTVNLQERSDMLQAQAKAYFKKVKDLLKMRNIDLDGQEEYDTELRVSLELWANLEQQALLERVSPRV